MLHPNTITGTDNEITVVTREQNDVD